jgi:hypothetical protein
VITQQVLGIEAEPLERAGAGALDQDVGGRHQPAHAFEVRAVLEVEHHRALVAADQLPNEGLAVGVLPPQAAGAVAGRRLHLHHVGPEVGEVAGGPGSRDHRGHVDDPEPLECLHGAEGTRSTSSVRTTR